MNLQDELRSYVESHYPMLYLVTFEEKKAEGINDPPYLLFLRRFQIKYCDEHLQLRRHKGLR